LADLPHGLFGIADGVGGVPGGAEAAEATRATVMDGFAAELRQGRVPSLSELAQQANVVVRDLGEKISPSTGIATTLTVGSFRGDQVEIAHVGDSRCYCWHSDRFLNLTTDHSEGRVLTRCLGLSDVLLVDVIQRRLEPGDRYLFCSDGLTNFAREPQIAGLLRQSDDPASIAGELVRLALAGGGGDNVSVVVVLVG